MDSAKSMPDLSVGRSQSVKVQGKTPYMSSTGEGKKKKGFFSFFKKEKKFSLVCFDLCILSYMFLIDLSTGKVFNVTFYILVMNSSSWIC